MASMQRKRGKENVQGHDMTHQKTNLEQEYQISLLMKLFENILGGTGTTV